MQVVNEDVFPRKIDKSLYDSIARAESDTVFQLTKGVDFFIDPRQARATIRSALRERGVKVATRTRGDHIFVRVNGSDA